MTQFASPASNAQLAPSDVLNHLLLIKPLSVEANVPTAYGESDAVRCDVADLTTGMLHENVLWFPRVLVSSLQTRLGQMVLAAMGQGQAKPGQSAPWILIDAAQDPGAVNTAQAWLAQNPTFDPSRPNVASPAAPAPQVPAYQPPPAPAYQAPQAPAAAAAPAHQPPVGVDPAAV
jgi:hypothetical protein